MIAVGTVALLIWGAMLGTLIVRLLQARADLRHRPAPMAGNGRQGSRDAYAYAQRRGDPSRRLPTTMRRWPESIAERCGAPGCPSPPILPHPFLGRIRIESGAGRQR